MLCFAVTLSLHELNMQAAVLCAPSAASTLEGRTEKKLEEDAIVAVAHAAVDPGAVVVHAQHAAPAQPAVVRTGRLVPRTLGAEARLPTLRTGNVLGYKVTARPSAPMKPQCSCCGCE